MPYRTIGILSGLAGLALILFLILLHRDLERHAITGPRWKRRIVTAGLVVLAALGFKPSAQADRRGICTRPRPARSPPAPIGCG